MVSVSVVIPCRNAADTLAAQLEALTRQTYAGDWDVIVSDNGSTDHTRVVVQRYLDRLPGLRVVDSSDRRGAGHARNVAARASSARRLAFCDADDEVSARWLERIMRALDAHPFVAGRLEALRLNRSPVVRSRKLPQESELQESSFGPGLPHASAENLAVDRETFLSVGGFDPEVLILEDTDLCWRLQLAGTALAFAPDAIVHVRLRSSISGMWRQGWGYGHAEALLAERFRSVPPVGEQAMAQTGRVGNFFRLIRENRSPAAAVWVLGWHAGHWAFTRGGVPAPRIGRA